MGWGGVGWGEVAWGVGWGVGCGVGWGGVGGGWSCGTGGGGRPSDLMGPHGIRPISCGAWYGLVDRPWRVLGSSPPWQTMVWSNQSARTDDGPVGIAV